MPESSIPYNTVPPVAPESPLEAFRAEILTGSVQQSWLEPFLLAQAR